MVESSLAERVAVSPCRAEVQYGGVSSCRRAVKGL